MTMARTSSDVVDAVWRALRDGPEPTRPNAMEAFVGRVRGADLVPGHAVLDLVDDLGFRDLAHADGLLAAFGVSTVAGFARPSPRLRMCIGTAHIAVADVAALLLRLERHGLDVDPEPLAEALRPALAHRAILTSAELAVWWHAEERHRSDGVTLATDNASFATTETVRTPAGYRAEAWIGTNGRAVQVWIRSPRFRRRRAA